MKDTMFSRHWLFVLPNPKACLDFQSSECVRYAVYQEEVSNDTGLHHFMGYIELDRTVRLSYVKKLKGLEKSHFEIRKGTRDQARDYCMKDDNRVDGPWEHGVWKAGGQGRRNDMTEMWNAIKDGATEMEIMEQFPELYMRYHRAISIRCASQRRTQKSIVTLIVGPPGVGKSKYCLDNHPEAYWLSRNKNKTWWQGYNRQDTVIIDGLDHSWIKFNHLKQLLDMAKQIIITSSRDPRAWYSSRNKSDNKALMRRMDKIIVMPEPNKQIIFNGHEEYIATYPNPTEIYI